MTATHLLTSGRQLGLAAVGHDAELGDPVLVQVGGRTFRPPARPHDVQALTAINVNNREIFSIGFGGRSCDNGNVVFQKPTRGGMP